MTGRFYGIGVGPGDPELLTLKGRRLLQEVAVICYPESAPARESIALSIVASLVEGERDYLGLRFPMVTDRAVLENAWTEAAARVAAELERGRDVAFITMGDPSLYSTYAHLVRKLRCCCPGVTVETVPGVASFSAAAASLGLPLAEGGETLAIVPAAGSLAGLDQALREFDNLVLIKVHRQLPQIVEVLAREGRKEGAIFACRVGCAGGFIETDLDSLPGRELDYLSLIIVKRQGVER